MRFWRSIEFRLAAWYSLLLLAGLLSLGAVLWIGVNYSMVATVDELLAARMDNLVDLINAEFGQEFLEVGADQKQGELKGKVQQVGPRREWLLVEGTKIRLTPETLFKSDSGPFLPTDLQAGQYVGVVVERAGEEWLAAGVSLETSFQQELHEYTLAVPDGKLIQIRTAGGETLLPMDPDPDKPAPVPGREEAPGQRRFQTMDAGSGLFRVLHDTVSLAGASYQVQLASSLAPVTATRKRLLSWLAGALPVGLVLSLCGGYMISRVALRPVEKVVSVAGRIDVGRMSERLDVPATGDVVQRLADTFNGMLGRLEVSVNRLEEFTADASHELRSPVSVIRTTAELALRQARSDEELRRDMKEIQEEATRLTDLIEDLLTLARSDSGPDAAPQSDISLDALAREVAERHQLLVGRRLLAVEIEETDAVVRGHEGWLRRLLVILLDNAVRHTPEETAIKVSVRQQGEQLVLAVADTGEGIPPDELNRVFDRFYRVDPSRNRSHGGFGLGLSIAKWIAELHGGSITAASQLGKGSTFSVLLPRHTAAVRELLSTES